MVVLAAIVAVGSALRLAGIGFGLPAVYNTFFGYDEVAHHSGIDREDAFKVLATLDGSSPIWSMSPAKRRAPTTSSSSPITARARAPPSSRNTACRWPT